MKITKKQQTPELISAVRDARTLGGEAYRNGIRRVHDDGRVIDLASSNDFSFEQRAAIFSAWIQGATKAMFAEVNV